MIAGIVIVALIGLCIALGTGLDAEKKTAESLRATLAAQDRTVTELNNTVLELRVYAWQMEQIAFTVPTTHVCGCEPVAH